MIESNFAITGTFIVYLIGMMAIGYYAYKRTSQLGRLRARRPLHRPDHRALSAGASDMSGWLLLGLPGYALAAGFESTWIAVGLLAGTWLNWLFVAQRLRIYSAHGERRGDHAGVLREPLQRQVHAALRVVSALIILTFFLFYTSSGLVASASCSRPCSASTTRSPCSSAPWPSSPTPCSAASSPWPGPTWCRAC
jgi:sodium/proline symporter